jgi:hypothetical protein
MQNFALLTSSAHFYTPRFVVVGKCVSPPINVRPQDGSHAIANASMNFQTSRAPENGSRESQHNLLNSICVMLSALNNASDVKL